MRGGLYAAVLALGVFAARNANANCARPVGYGAEETDGGVVIRLENFAGRACPDKDGLLRQNVATGDTVRVDTCFYGDAGVDDGNGKPFFDACVPAGQYRYGFAQPYECLPSACSTEYFTTVDVRNPSACVAPVRAKVQATPWGSDPMVCTYGGRLSRALIGLLVVIALAGFGIVRAVRKKKPAP